MLLSLPQVESLLLSHEFGKPFNFYFELKPMDWYLLSSISCRWMGTAGQPFALACVSLSSPHVWWSLFLLRTPFCFGSGVPFTAQAVKLLQVLCTTLPHCLQVDLRFGFVLPLPFLL